MACPLTGIVPESIASELRAWLNTGLRIAIWGSAAEAAVFLETHSLDPRRIPVVVDSGPAGQDAPAAGGGQSIRSPDWLREHPADIILIPCARRAARIVREIDAARIAYEGILVPQDGRLVDFHAVEMVFA